MPLGKDSVKRDGLMIQVNLKRISNQNIAKGERKREFEFSKRRRRKKKDIELQRLLRYSHRFRSRTE